LIGTFTETLLGSAQTERANSDPRAHIARRVAEFFPIRPPQIAAEAAALKGDRWKLSDTIIEIGAGSVKRQPGPM